MKRAITVQLSEFCVEALAQGEGKDSKWIPSRLARAVRLYLSARGSKRPGWSVPSVLRQRGYGDVELRLVADEKLLRELEKEAGKQGVSVSRLAGQAAIYYSAELDAGRITQSILDDLDEEGA